MHCPLCDWEMKQHQAIEVIWCVNPHCRQFDLPQQIKREARLITEKPDSLPACQATNSRI